MSHPWMDELTAGLSAVRKASEICQAVQAAITPDILDKKDNSPVTIADFASQAVICRILGEAFPNDPVIAEEDSLALHQSENEPFLKDICDLILKHDRKASADEICGWIDRGSAKDYSNRFWTLDPIDGTKGFLRKDQYAISLALIVNGQIEVGILGCPRFSDISNSPDPLFYAVRGHGAFASGANEGDPSQAIRVSPNSDPGLSRFCESFESRHSSHSESSVIAERLGIKSTPLRLDSQAKYAVVACGAADAYLRLPTKPGYFEKIWDHAGGVLIVQEAGGRVTDLYGKPLNFSLGFELRQNRGVIATNGQFHEEILSIAQSVVAVTPSQG